MVHAHHELSPGLRLHDTTLAHPESTGEEAVSHPLLRPQLPWLQFVEKVENPFPGPHTLPQGVNEVNPRIYISISMAYRPHTDRYALAYGCIKKWA